MLRSSGVVLPLTALPGPYGIGSLGDGAVAMAERLCDAGFSYWQILPIGPTGAGDSPYQSLSTFAGHPYLIDIDTLATHDLLTTDEVQTARHQSLETVDDMVYERIDYAWLWATRHALLARAASRLDNDTIAAYVRDTPWIRDYAAFMTIKRHHDERPWWTWPPALRDHVDDAVDTFVARHATTHRTVIAVQCLFAQQWAHFRAAVKALGLSIVGDLPLYVASDSCDVWAHRHFFEIDSDGRQGRQAGVPPDCYSPYGQLWGNPLYRWSDLAQDGYAWWLQRLTHAIETYDLVRLDHFIGFVNYWAVDRGAATAQSGRWEQGPGSDFFDVVLRTFPVAPFIVENLGFVSPAVREFHRQTGLPGMKVLPFHFDLKDKTAGRPHTFETNLVAYASTHDSDTLTGWLNGLDDATWALVRDYVGAHERDRHSTGSQSRLTRAVLRTLWQTPADLVMIQLQDALGMDNAMRTNVPGTATGNWRLRFRDADLRALDIAFFRRLNDVFERSPGSPRALSSLHHESPR